MKRSMILESDIKKRGALALVVIAVVIMTMCVILVKHGYEISENEVNSYLSEISQQTSYKVNQRIELNMDKLKNIGSTVKYLNQKDYVAYFQEELNNSAYKWIAWVSENGSAVLIDGRTIDMSELEAVQNALHGTAGINGELYEFDGMLGALYAVPYLNEGSNQALVGWVPTNTMELLLHTDTFDGTGFSHIVSQNGNFILHSKNKNAVVNGNNFFDVIEEQGEIDSKYSLSRMKNDLKEGKEGVIEFTINGEEKRMLIYKPLNEGNWYIFSIVPPDIYSAQISAYISQSVLTVAVVVCLLFLFLFSILWIVTKRKNKEIYDIAFLDPVTGGFTQARMEIELAEKMNRFEPFSFVSLDLKKFKLINDMFGSTEGNKVLKYVYHCIKDSLYDGEYVARVRDDNFNIVFRTVDKDTISKRLTKISESINEFNKKRKTPYYIQTVCGTYIVNNREDNIIIIRDRANSARKRNKQNGILLCDNLFYNDLERINMLKEKEIEDTMDKALENHDFKVFLQPKVNLKTGKVSGAEALVRWIDPIKGMIYPNDFIPLFERNGFILKLDLYVFEEVCKLLQKWKNEGRTLYPISVNLSRNHLHQKDFLEDYERIQKKYDVSPELLEIELTETVVFENLSLLKKVIDNIHEIGFLCSMDDFGSGYSSLNILKEIPVDGLKLDRIFFDKKLDQRSKDVIQSVIELAEKLNMATVAEGIETIPQVEILQKMKCDMIQGYVFDKPMPIAEFEDKYRNNPDMIKAISRDKQEK
ncbi:MAG: EAL domain-containing protein [Beduini sp.]|uniref:bifunctional diguanylate cyclase/phosphodiesterase n=1 Tax=Beduini sp. TaxID=1922300 RepID=UPI0039909A96